MGSIQKRAQNAFPNGVNLVDNKSNTTLLRKVDF